MESGDEIELLSDGDGITVYGEQSAVEGFLTSVGLLAQSKDLGLHRLGSLLRTGEAIATEASEAAADSARWLKATPESVQAIKDIGLVETDTPGVSYAMAGRPGAISSWIKIETGPTSLLTNPAVLAGAAGIMGQLAGQHEMTQIRDYLAAIDIKLEDVLNSLRNAELSKILGASRDIESAMALLESQGRLDRTTWETVKGRQETISNAQEWALLELGDIANRLQKPAKVHALAKMAERIEAEVRTLHVVLAHSVELQDAYDVLRLSRVQEESPELLDEQRLKLRADRMSRRDRIQNRHEHLMARMLAAADFANSKALLHQPSLRTVVDSTNVLGTAVLDFSRPLDIEPKFARVERTRWRDATRSAQQLRTAGAEVGVQTLKIGAVAVALVGAAVVAKKGSDGEPGDGG